MCRPEVTRMIQIMLLKSLVQVSVTNCWFWDTNLKLFQLFCTNMSANPSGDSRFPDHKHAHSAAQLLPGAAAVLLSNRRPWDSTAGAGNSSQSYRQAWEQTQVLQNQVCILSLNEHSLLQLVLTLLGFFCAQHRLWHLCAQAETGQMLQTGQFVYEKGQILLCRKVW